MMKGISLGPNTTIELMTFKDYQTTKILKNLDLVLAMEHEQNLLFDTWMYFLAVASRRPEFSWKTG